MARFAVGDQAVSPQVYIFSEVLDRVSRRDCAMGRRAQDIAGLVRNSVSTIVKSDRPNERVEGRELGAHDLLRLLEHVDATTPGLLKTLGLGGHPDGLAATLKQFMKCDISKTDLLIAVFAHCLCTRGFPSGWLSAALRRCREVDHDTRHLHDGRRVPAAALARYVSDRPRERREPRRAAHRPVGQSAGRSVRRSVKRSVKCASRDTVGRPAENFTKRFAGHSGGRRARRPVRGASEMPRRLRYEV